MQSRRYLTIILIVGFFTHFAYAQYTIEGLTSCTGGGFAQDAANTAFSTMGQASPPDTAVSGDYFLYSGSIYVFDIEEIQAFVAAPVFSPESGDYRDSVKVWITCSTEGAEIYYTKNGHDPTNADLLYSDTLIIDTTRLATYLAGGVKLNEMILYGFLLFVPMSFLGARVAKSIVDKIPQKYFRVVVSIFLLLVGLKLLLWG